MSGLYIPDIELPKGYETLHLFIFKDGDFLWRYGATVPTRSEEKAVEVSDHGNLIDREIFRREMDNHYPFDKYTQSQHGEADYAKSTIISMLANAPIVIKGET